MTRLPKSPAERQCSQHADDGEDSLSASEPGEREQRASFVVTAALFGVGQQTCDENEQGGPCREGVVLLVGGEREEEQDKGRVEAEQPVGADAKFEPRYVGGYVFARGVVVIE